MSIWEEMHNLGVKDFKRYKLISNYFKDHPERVGANTDYISDIMFAVLNMHENLRVGSHRGIQDLMKNFGIRDICQDSKTRYFVFKE